MMKPESEETKIQTLFQQLKQEDERRAPSFARSWAAARAQHERDAQPGRFGRVWRFAAAGLVLLSLGTAWLVYHRAAKRAAPTEPTQLAISVPPPVAAPPAGMPPLPVEKPVKAIRQRRSSPRLQPGLVLLSQWRSPTEFLLRTPGDALLKTLPRLGESLIEMKALAPEQKNELEEQ